METKTAMYPYIGTKWVTACPKIREEKEGYLVRYADGYEGWSPKEVFEAAYLPVTVNHNLRTDKPSISQEMVDAFIAKIEVQTMGEKTTVVRAVLCNGFEIVEASACVSKENYDEELGRQICLEKIKDKVWMLLGFLLQTAVNGINYRESEEECTKDMSFGDALEMAKCGKRIARRGWNGKGQYVFLAFPDGFHTMCDLSAHDGEEVEVGDVLVIRTAKGGFQPGWLASQADMLAEDWYIYREETAD